MQNQQDEQIFQKLSEWIGSLENHIVQLHEQRIIFERVREIVRGNAALTGNVFLESLKLWYSASMSIAVRRLADKHPDSMSYFRFLTIIEKNPRAISRSRVFNAWNGHELAGAAFDEHTGATAPFLPTDVVKADLAKLELETKVITDFADKYVAHNDPVATVPTPKFEDVSTALKCLETLHNKYAVLLTGHSTSMEPVVLYPWENIFRQPWINPDNQIG